MALARVRSSAKCIPQSLDRCSQEALKAYDFVYDVFGVVAPG